MVESMSIDKMSLMKKIQQLQFMSVEYNLYLDTHPDDLKALAQYNYFSEQLTMLKKQYDEMYGPIMGFGCSQSKNGWKWIYEKWPWENSMRGEM